MPINWTHAYDTQARQQRAPRRVGRCQARTLMTLTLHTLRARGAEHARAGKRLTPADCHAIDRELLDAARQHDRPARWYARMRGAFNRGWEAEYAAMLDRVCQKCDAVEHNGSGLCDDCEQDYATIGRQNSNRRP